MKKGMPEHLKTELEKLHEMGMDLEESGIRTRWSCSAWTSREIASLW